MIKDSFFVSFIIFIDDMHHNLLCFKHFTSHLLLTHKLNAMYDTFHILCSGYGKEILQISLK